LRLFFGHGVDRRCKVSLRRSALPSCHGHLEFSV